MPACIETCLQIETEVWGSYNEKNRISSFVTHCLFWLMTSDTKNKEQTVFKNFPSRFFFLLCFSSWWQFHQHFYVRIFCMNVVLAAFQVTFWLWQKIRTKNTSVQCWWNWHLWLILPTLILSAAFMLVDPKSAKKDCRLDCILVLLESARIKAVHKMLMKLTPVVNFTNILWAAFAQIFFCKKITKPICK